MKKSFAISAGHPATLLAAQEVLIEGGNAVDAAIAAYLTSFVAEPCMASAGAGGFAMVKNGIDIQVVDFFCETPLQKKDPKRLDFYPITVDFGSATEDFYIGKGSVATPGAIAGIYHMHELYGSIPMKHLASNVIQKAKDGIAIDSFQAYDFNLLAEIFAISKEDKSKFYNNDKLKKEGDLVKMPAFADFLDVLSIEGPDLFYKGEVARSIASDFKDAGGNLDYDDFANYKSVLRKPLSFDWNGFDVHTTPSPSAGGAIIAAFLKEFITQVNKTSVTPLSREHFKHLVNTFETVNAVKDNSEALNSFLKSKFGIDTFQSSEAHKWSGTSHFNVVDGNRLAVALTTSIGEGCGYFIPGTDMQLNNMLGEAALLPSGYHSWTPGRRLRSMMTPTLVTEKNGMLRMLTGTGGAGRIPFAIAQVIINHLYFGQTLEEATEQSRVHVHNGLANVESGYDIENKDDIKSWEPGSLFFGGVSSISKKKGTYIHAAGDYRRSGVALTNIN